MYRKLSLGLHHRVVLQYDKHSDEPRGWTWHIYRQGSAEYFLGFEFRKSVLFWVLVTAAVFFGLLKINAVLLTVSYF